MGTISSRFTKSEVSVLGVNVFGVSLGRFVVVPSAYASQGESMTHATANAAQSSNRRTMAKPVWRVQIWFWSFRSFVISPRVNAKDENQASRQNPVELHFRRK
jgi:hypothetical protein